MREIDTAASLSGRLPAGVLARVISTVGERTCSLTGTGVEDDGHVDNRIGS